MSGKEVLDEDKIIKCFELAKYRDYYEIKQVDRMLSYSAIKSSYAFCDVGGGAGIDALPLSFVASFGICLDIDRVALKKGKKNSRTIMISHKIDFVRASATNLPFQNSAFDVVTSFSVIDHLLTKKNAFQAIEEFSRITKPHGYVILTFPNRLFFIGTILMKIKQMAQPETFFEQRFTPKEVCKVLESYGLTVLRYDSKYPTEIGNAVLEYNLPKIFQKIPKNLLKPALLLTEKFFRFIEISFPLKLLGARFGCLGQKF